MIDENNRLYAITDSGSFDAKVGEYVSLIPLTDKVTHLSTTGLEYEVSDFTLNNYSSLGQSNVAIDNKVSIKMGEGVLLVAFSKD